jgi:FkbM family methyltransferase
MRWKLKTKLEKARELYREFGAAALIRRSTRYAIVVLTGAAWQVRGTRSVAVDGVSATFDARRADLGTFGFFEVTERDVCEELLGELRSGDVFYDVGAHVGLYSCLVGRRLTIGEVVAFEPYPPNAEALEKNLERNDIDARVIQAALLDREGRVPFDDPGETSEIASIRTEATVGSTEVEAVTGDGLIKRDTIPPPNVVKIDVEGAGAQVLSGMETCLRDDRCRFVLCEVHDPAAVHGTYTSRPEEIQTQLAALGFTVEVASDDGGFESYLIGRK